MPIPVQHHPIAYWVVPPDRDLFEATVRLSWRSEGCTCNPKIEWPATWPPAAGLYDVIVVHEGTCKGFPPLHLL